LSSACLHFETDSESNIKTAEDALWWAFATITTVGYGDGYRVTWEGRLIATILMCAGVGLFGTFSGFLAAWFIGSEPGKGSLQVSADLRELREEVAALRRTLEERAGNTAAHQRDGPAQES
jgi:voltage-gated potassium channel